MVHWSRSWRGRGVMGLLVLGSSSCFRGEFLAGDPCRSDVDCGPELSCIEGLCGGLISPTEPVLTMDYTQVKQFVFTWTGSPEAQYYQLVERVKPGAPWLQLGGDIPKERTTDSFTMPLHFRFEASYALRACNTLGCAESAPVDVVDARLKDAIGYVKASNTDATDLFATSVALSADGNTLAVGAVYEDSSASGVNGPQSNNDVFESGAVYVYVRDPGGRWSRQAYLKPFEEEEYDAFFGSSVALSADGRTIAVGAVGEGGGPLDYGEGAAYVFVRNGPDAWSEQAYIKASNEEEDDNFGISVALSADGDTLAVGAIGEDGGVGGIVGDPNGGTVFDSGAVYAFVRDDGGQWSEQAYIKASIPGEADAFGLVAALSADGDTLAVGAPGESSSATGINGDPNDDSTPGSGAAYVFVRGGDGRWSEQAYVKAERADPCDLFGTRLALSADGDTLAVGAYGDDQLGECTSLQGDPLPGPGSVHVFTRDASSTWTQDARLQSSPIDDGDAFGGGGLEFAATTLALSERGNILAVGSLGEDGGMQGFGGDPNDGSLPESGAVFVFQREDAGPWSQRAYLKAPNTGLEDGFGFSVALSGDGETLAVGAPWEDSRAIDIGDVEADQINDLAMDAGAVYLF